jgi:hypothetical protein
VDGNGKGSEDEDNKGDKESEGNVGEGNKGKTESSPREERDDGHNNQLSTKVAAVVRTVVAIYGK